MYWAYRVSDIVNFFWISWEYPAKNLRYRQPCTYGTYSVRRPDCLVRICWKGFHFFITRDPQTQEQKYAIHKDDGRSHFLLFSIDTRYNVIKSTGYFISYPSYFRVATRLFICPNFFKLLIKNNCPYLLEILAMALGVTWGSHFHWEGKFS